MKILGLSCYYHDSAAALVIDGDIKAAAQEERFTRKKHDAAFPSQAIAFCLKEAGLKAGDLDAVVFYEKPLVKFERLLETYLHCAPQGIQSFILAMSAWTKEKLWTAAEIRKKLSYTGQIFYTTHHESHSASAFFPSPFEEAVIITADGVGEWTTTSISHGKGNRIELLKELKFPHSLGLLYSAFTYYTGFRVNSGEYKVMGLAPYGEPRYVDLILKHLMDLKEDGSFRLNMDYFNYMSGLTMTSKKFHALFGGPPRKAESPLTQKEMDLARSIQEVTERVMERMVGYAMKLTGLNKICLAGGVALNCVANGKLVKKLKVQDIFIQPAAGDAGGALGAALAAHYSIFKNPRRTDEKHDLQKASLLGPCYTENEIQKFIDHKQIKAQKLPEASRFQTLADLLTRGQVIGLFQGRMEYGPRALGGRSIIGDARNEIMQKNMNLKIKFRESFRPFAPLALEEDAKKYFDCPFKSPYMLLVGDLYEPFRIGYSHEQQRLFGIDKLNVKRSFIPAVTHIDYSARLQTISREENPFIYRLLAAFKAMTGVGILVNTSFNVRGEPIVCTPEDAYRCFMRTEMDYLLLENFLIKRTEQTPIEGDERWKKEFALD